MVRYLHKSFDIFLYLIYHYKLDVKIKTLRFQNKHSWLEDSDVRFKRSAQMTTTTIYMDNLFLKSIDWTFENINLQVATCSLATANLKIYQTLSKESYPHYYEGINVSIDDSSLCYLRANDVAQITIRNSYINGRNAVSSSFFVLQNSNMTISNSTFTNNSIKFNSTEPILLNASINSNIVFVNCTVTGNTGYISIIDVTDQSSLCLINSSINCNKIFNENISLKRHSIVRINESFVSAVNCTFTQNQLVSPSDEGAVLKIYAFSRSDLHLEGCIFKKNQGTSLSAHAWPGGKLLIKNCYIAENNSPWSTTGTFILNGYNGGAYYLFNCIFTKNYADDGGGVFSYGISTIHFRKCIFKENKAFTVGGVDICAAAITYFENCQFLANEGILHTGAIMGQYGAHLVIHNCLFKDNLGINDIGAVAIKLTQSELTVWNSTFINNTSENRAGAILLEGDATGSISQCTFINNSAVHHGCISVNSNVTLQIKSTYFIGNNAKVAAVIFSEYNATVEILFSKYEYNAGENSIEVRQNSSIIVMNSKFSDNNISSGSVIFVYFNSNVVVRNSTFFNHSTTQHGAVIYGSQNSNIYLKDSKMQQNFANLGGVIYIAHCTLQVAKTILHSNKGTDGGVIYTTFSNVHIQNSSCIYNMADGNGGCLCIAASNVSLKYSIMSHNHAFAGGAVMIFSNSDFSALKTNFYNNTAKTSGGAISQRLSGFSALDQCVFKYNSLSKAYHNFGSDIDAVQCTELRVSQSKFVHNATDPTAAIEVNRMIIRCTLFTHKINISYGSKYLSSTNHSFLNESLARGWISENSGLKQAETNYASRKYLEHYSPKHQSWTLHWD